MYVFDRSCCSLNCIEGIYSEKLAFQQKKHDFLIKQCWQRPSSREATTWKSRFAFLTQWGGLLQHQRLRRCCKHEPQRRHTVSSATPEGEAFCLFKVHYIKTMTENSKSAWIFQCRSAGVTLITFWTWICIIKGNSMIISVFWFCVGLVPQWFSVLMFILVNSVSQHVFSAI